jgi:hypothetical protein
MLMNGKVRFNVGYSSVFLPDNPREGLSRSSGNKGFSKQTVLILELTGVRGRIAAGHPRVSDIKKAEPLPCLGLLLLRGSQY